MEVKPKSFGSLKKLERPQEFLARWWVVLHMLEIVCGGAGGCFGGCERFKGENGAPTCGISAVPVRQCAPA